MPTRRYWDSTCFLAWLLPEPARVPDCRSVIRAAERGDVQIITSALTLTEVIHLKGGPHLVREEHEQKLRKFFLHQYIIVRNVDRKIAELARELIWRHGLKPKDSIHVATALRGGITILDTYDDKDFIALNGKIGTPPLRIGTPHEVEQLALIVPATPAPEDAGPK